MVAETRRYCCFNLSYFPPSVESLGYKTLVIYSALCLAYRALQYSPLLNANKSNSFKGRDFQSLSPIVLNVAYPGIGVSQALAMMVSQSYQSDFYLPFESYTFLTVPQNFILYSTSTLYIYQGFPLLNQKSGTST